MTKISILSSIENGSSQRRGCKRRSSFLFLLIASLVFLLHCYLNFTIFLFLLQQKIYASNSLINILSSININQNFPFLQYKQVFFFCGTILNPVVQLCKKTLECFVSLCAEEILGQIQSAANTCVGEQNSSYYQKNTTR